MTFLDLSKNVQGVLIFWASLTEMLYLFNLFRFLQIGRRKSKTRCILLCIGNFLLLQIMMQYVHDPNFFPVPLPVWLLLLLIALFTTLSVTEQYRLVKWSRTHVSATSIKEALDALPTGLCYALPEGLPLLTNAKMEELGRLLSGSPWLNAKETWNALEEGRFPGVIQSGEQPIYELKDEKIYSFRKESVNLKEGRVVVMMAMDVTREFALTRELSEKQAKERQINARLKSLKETIDYAAKSKELLQIKVALHDNLGRSLLAAKRYLYNPESVDPRELLDIWKLNLSHLIGDKPKEWQIPYYVTRKEASSLGIELQIVGTLPEEERLLPVVEQAISAHVINVLRHADGHVAMIHVFENDREYEITFTNDGKIPEGEIQVRGGLGSLKRQVEDLGGSFALSSKPKFEMKIYLPRKI